MERVAVEFESKWRGELRNRSDVRATFGRLDAFCIKWSTENRRFKTFKCPRSCYRSRMTSIKSNSPRSSGSFRRV